MEMRSGKLSEEHKLQVDKSLPGIAAKYGTTSKTSKKEDHKIIEKV